MAIEYKRRKERRGTIGYYSTAGASEVPLEGEIVVITDDAKKVIALLIGDGETEAGSLREFVPTAFALRDKINTLQGEDRIPDSAIKREYKATISGSTALNQNLSGKIVEARGAITLTANLADLGTDFGAYFLSTGGDTTFTGDVNETLKDGEGAWLINTVQNGFTLIPDKVGTGGETVRLPQTLTIGSDTILNSSNAGDTYVYDGGATISITSDKIPFNLLVKSGSVAVDLLNAPAGTVNIVRPDSDGKTGLLQVLVDEAGSYHVEGSEGATYEAPTTTLDDQFGARLLEHFVMSEASVTGSDIDSVTGRKGAVLAPADAAAKPVLSGGYAIGDGLAGPLETDIPAVAVDTLTVVLKARVPAASGDDTNRFHNGTGSGYRGFRLNGGIDPEVIMFNSAGTFKSDPYGLTPNTGTVYTTMTTYYTIDDLSSRYKDAAQILTIGAGGAARDTAPQSAVILGSNHTKTKLKYEFSEAIFISGALSQADIDFLDNYLGV